MDDGSSTSVGTADGVVTVFGDSTGALAEAYEASWADWETENGIDIQYSGDVSFDQALSIRVQGGDAPDVALFSSPGALKTAIDSGKVQELPAAALANVEKNWSEDWRANGRVDGVQYATPTLANVKGFVWYSPSKFEEWGVSVPRTWDEMLAVSKTIAEKTGGPSWCAGFNSGDASGWPGTDWVEDYVLRADAVETYDSWAAGDTPFTDPAISEAFDAVGTVLLDPALTNATFGGVKSINSTAWGDVAPAVANGECPLTHQATFFEDFVTSATNASGEPATVAPDGDVWVFMTPPLDESDDKRALAGGEYAAAFSDDADTAQVLEYLSSADWGTSRVSLGGMASANRGVDPSAAGSPLQQYSVEVLTDPETTFRFDASDIMPKSVGSDTFLKGMVDWVDGVSTDEVLEEIQSGYDG